MLFDLALILVGLDSEEEDVAEMTLGLRSR